MFKAEAKKISDLFNRKVMSVPRNQRKYVWDKTNWEDLFSDLVFILNDEYRKDERKEEHHHFIGSIVLQVMNEEKGLTHCSIIDGQQRTVTITLLMLALLAMFKENKFNDSFNGTRKYLVFIDDDGKEQFILSSSNYISIKKIASKIIDADNNQSIEELLKIYIVKKEEKIFGDCLIYFYSRLKEEASVHPVALRNFLNGIRDALVQTSYIDISATSEEDSYTIFEILNARGMELEDHELIKNFIMRYILPQSKVDEVRDRWKVIEDQLGTQINRFFAHYTSHRFVIPNKQSVFRTIQNNIKKSEVQDLFDDIVLKMRYYKKIISPVLEGDDKNCNSVEFELFTFLKSRRAEQFRPLFLSLMHVWDMKQITEAEYNDTLKFIYSFFVCFNIIGQLKSNRLTDSLVKSTRLIENDFNINRIAELKDSLKLKLPNLSVFISNFKTIGWSHEYDFYKDSRRKDNVKAVLELIEKYKSKASYVQPFTIEHVLDDSCNIANAQIGNLLPLEEKLNAQCNGKSFAEKLIIYSSSNYGMTRAFAIRYKNVAEFNPEKRSEYMAKLIYKDILGLNE
jgi:uncharacterized protein with ParB-like and HNH nuclease domain